MMIKIRDEIFQYYFYFIQERMKMFWLKFNGEKTNFTNDPILKHFKFTNVYRASDRVSQYLIKNVIYNQTDQNLSEKDVLLRIIIFKIFNKIETWDYLQLKTGTITEKNFDIEKINKILQERKNKRPIFSNAYMMTGTHSKYNYLKYKHEKWLTMIKKELLDGGVFDKIIKAKNLQEIYELLRDCSFIGDFLAYQYAIDFNYASFIDFNENSFVKAGIGSIRGIKKCFKNVNNKSYEFLINYTLDNFDKYQKKYGFTEFEHLFGREPTLIDIQNCFCETDKYLRAKIPELQIDNVRIKQRYKGCNGTIQFFFPPKWNLSMTEGN